MRGCVGAAVVVVMLAAAGPVFGQTHPCDQASPTTVTVSSSSTHKVQFCGRPSDSPEAFTVYLDGIASDLRPLTMVVGPNASGLALYEGPRELQFAVGSHSVQLTLWNREYTGGPSQESARSDPLSLTAVAGAAPATAPVIKGVVR